MESFCMYPFILLGKLIFLFGRKKEEYQIYFFFPFYHIGGAEKLHYQIAKACGGKNAIIYFTRKSAGKDFLPYFEQSGCTIRDISMFTDNKWLYFLNLVWRGRIAAMINKQAQKPVVFNGQCNFAYKISPWIQKDIKQLELIHALNTFSYIRLPFLSFYSKSITVSDEVIAMHKTIYSKIDFPVKLFEKFIAIESKIDLPKKGLVKNYHANPLQVLFIGRNSFEKRPHLVAEVAEKLAGYNNIQFSFIGDVKDAVPANLQQYCNFIGPVHEEEQVNAYYEKAHILIVPSSSESGPLVFMEAMSRGCSVIATPVGYMPNHIKNGISGFLTSATVPENEVVEQMSAYVLQLHQNRDLLETMGKHNAKYAAINFDNSIFVKAYRNLLN